MPGFASDEVQLTIKQHFLPLTKHLKKGHPIPIKTNNLGTVKCPMTGGRDLQGIRFVIEYLNNLPQGMKSSTHDEWKKGYVGRQDGILDYLISYRSSAFSSHEDAVRYAFPQENAMKPLHYTGDEIEG